MAYIENRQRQSEDENEVSEYWYLHDESLSMRLVAGSLQSMCDWLY